MHRQLKQLVVWGSRKRVLLFVLIFSMSLLGSIIYRFAEQNKRLEKEFNTQAQNIDLNKQITELSLLIKNAGSAGQGYNISEDPKFAETYIASIDSIVAINQKIQQREIRYEDASVDSLFMASDSLIQQKVAFMQRIKSLYDNHESKAAADLIGTNKGVYLSHSISEINKQLGNKIQAQLKKSQAEFRQIKSNNNNLAYAGIIVSMILVVLVFCFLLKEISKTKKISEDLQVRKENYRVTINSLNEALISTDKEGHILYMNPIAERLTGWSWQDAKKQPLHSVFNVVNEETGEPFEHIVSRILKTGKSIELENNTLLKAKDSGTYIISNSGSPIFDLNGHISGAVLMFNDITDKYRIQKELKENHELYKNLINTLPEAVYTCDAQGYIQLYNKAAVKLWGREPVAGKDLWCGSWKIFNTDGTDLLLDSCPMALTLSEGMPVHGKEIIVQRPDESFRHVLPYPSPLFNAQGELLGAVNMLLDITDKKEREILTQKTEQKYQHLVEQAGDAIIIYSFDGTIHEFNKSCYTMLGYSKEEFTKLSLTDILVEDIIVDQNNYAAILAGDTKTVYRILRHKDGSHIQAELTVKMLADGMAIAFARDITERKKAEKEIIYSNLRLEHGEKLAKIGSWQRDRVSNKRYWSKNMFHLFGLEPAENPPELEDYLACIHPDDRKMIADRLQKIEQGQELPGYEYRTNPERGPVRHLFVTLFYEKDSTGVIINYSGCILDITDRKKSEHTIKESEIFTRSILASIRSQIAVVDENGFILDVNDAWNDFSIKNDETILNRTGKGSNYLEVCQKAADSGDIIAAKVLAGFIQVSKNEIPFFETVYPCHSPGTERWFQLTITKFVGDSGKVVMNHTDITDLKKASKEAADYKNALSQSSILAITDQKGIIRDVNENFCNISQYTAAELIGNDHRIVNSGYHPKSFMKNLWATIASGKIWRGEVCNKAKDGTLYWVDATIVPVLNDIGKPYQYIAIRWDISKRKIAETMMREAIDRYDILAQATSDTIWDWDIVNNTMLYNDGITKMFGYNESDVKNVVEWWNEKLHTDDFQKVTELLDDIFENSLQKFQLTYRFRCADGSYKHIFDRAYVLFDENGKPARMIGAMQDITYQVEEEIRVAKAIIDAQEQERNFLGAELHDNVNQILAGTLLTLGIAKSKEADTQQRTEFIDSAIGYITDAINETRKLSHNLAPASFDDNSLKDLFENLLLNLNLDKRFNITLHFDELNKIALPENIQINIYRILQEQTKNILKYSEASAIEVSLQLHNNILSLRIFDNGKGFNTKNAKKGIGLSNIKKRAEALAGKFILNSAPGKGCELIAAIPLGI
jgi:PAS domain S-box-containing protein